MKKELFESPIVDVIIFAQSDILTVSGEEDELPPGGGGGVGWD